MSEQSLKLESLKNEELNRKSLIKTKIKLKKIDAIKVWK